MKKLRVSIEIDGKQIFAGSITGNSQEDATFSYSEEYIAEKHP